MKTSLHTLDFETRWWGLVQVYKADNASMAPCMPFLSIGNVKLLKEL